MVAVNLKVCYFKFRYGYDKGVIVIIGNKCDLTDKRIISETKSD